MTSKERVLGALNKKKTDRIPVHYEGTPEVNHTLLEALNLDNMEQLRYALGDDLRYLEPDYIGPTLEEYPDGSVEGYWGERYKYKAYEGGAYLEPVFLPFENIFEMKDLDESRFPTADIFRYDNFKEKCLTYDNRFAICIGSAGDMDFINSIGRARGMEQVLIDLYMDDPVYLRIMEARFQFYYDTHERLLQAADGLIDIAHIGEDLGNQNGPMISMEIFDKHFAPKLEKYCSMVHSYGSKTMMHMCGTVDRFLPRLINLGLDIQDVIQPTTPEMDIASLAANFGENISFCGSLCVQSTLPHGDVDEVHRETSRRVDLFNQGGMILGPSHAIQVGTPVENILEIYRTAGSLASDKEIEEIRKTVVGDSSEADTINMSKLF
jgi:uroporphyrinogen decarboxylase